MEGVSAFLVTLAAGLAICLPMNRRISPVYCIPHGCNLVVFRALDISDQPTQKRWWW